MKKAVSMLDSSYQQENIDIKVRIKIEKVYILTILKIRVFSIPYISR